MLSEPRYRWLLLSLGWLIYFSFGLIYTAIAPLVAPIMNDLDLTYTQMGVISGAWQLIYIFSAQPMGFVTDRLGVEKSLLIGGIVVSTSSLLRIYSAGFTDLFAYVAMFGLGGPLVSIGTTKLVSISFIGESRGLAQGINASGSVFGSMTALGITNSIVLPAAGSWRNVFFYYGVFGLCVSVVWFIFSSGRTGGKDLPDSSEIIPGNGSLRELLKHFNIWLIIWMGIVYFLLVHGLQNWLPRMLEHKGFSAVAAGYATSVMTFSSIIGNITIPRLSYLIGSRRVMISIVLFISGCSILILGMSGGLTLWVGILLTGFFTRTLMPLLTLTLMEMPEIGVKRIGTVVGLFFAVGEVGGFLGPFLTGYLRDLTGSFLPGILLLSIIAEASIVPLIFQKRGRGALMIETG